MNTRSQDESNAQDPPGSRGLCVGASEDNVLALRHPLSEVTLGGDIIGSPHGSDGWTRSQIKAVHAYPVSGTSHGLTKRVIPALADHARRHFMSLDLETRSQILMNRGTPRFRISLSELKELLGEEARTDDQINQAIDAVYDWDINWDLIGLTRDGRYDVIESFKSRIIVSRGRDAENHPGTISYELGFDVFNFILEPKARAQIDLHVMNQIGSAYAIAIYETCVQYFLTPTMLTPQWTVDEWITRIAGKNKYGGQWPEFKRFVLKPAFAILERVNSCPFTVEAIEVSAKGSKKIVACAMQLVPKHQADLDLDTHPLTWTPMTVDTLKKVYEFDERSIHLLSRTTTEAEITEAMLRNKILHDAGKGSHRFDGQKSDYLRLLVHQVQSGGARGADPLFYTVPSTKEQYEKEALVQRLKVDFQDDRVATFNARALRLGASKLTQLRLEFMEELKTTGEAFGVKKRAMDRGWGKTNKQLHNGFIEWIIAKRPEIADSLLPEMKYRDVAAWIVSEKMTLAIKESP